MLLCKLYIPTCQSGDPESRLPGAAREWGTWSGCRHPASRIPKLFFFLLLLSPFRCVCACVCVFLLVSPPAFCVPKCACDQAHSHSAAAIVAGAVATGRASDACCIIAVAGASRVKVDWARLRIGAGTAQADSFTTASPRNATCLGKDHGTHGCDCS